MLTRIPFQIVSFPVPDLRTQSQTTCFRVLPGWDRHRSRPLRLVLEPYKAPKNTKDIRITLRDSKQAHFSLLELDGVDLSVNISVDWMTELQSEFGLFTNIILLFIWYAESLTSDSICTFTWFLNNIRVHAGWISCIPIFPFQICI